MIRPRNFRTAGDMETERGEDWRSLAACRDADPFLFHVPGDSTKGWHNKKHAEQINEARSVCMSCPVSAECLQFAIDTNDADGFLGGLTPDERRALLRSNRKKATA